MSQSLPPWALQRVSTALQVQQKLGVTSVSHSDLARRTGLSKSLARRCLNQIRATNESHATALKSA